ncbi:MAG TPA: DNA alkylation repair protein [Ktedonobacteraceae bacterium]|nr:DNA alkylation repair protein [Ktedonobacteraceae bacterium]
MEVSESIEINEFVYEIDSRIRALPNLKAESVRSVRKEFSKRLTHTSPRIVVSISMRLLQLDRPGFEYRFVAYELVAYHKAALRSLGEEELEILGQGMSRWGDVDTFACYLAGPAWREFQVPDALIHSWAQSEDRWWRRAAVVCTVALNNKARGGSGDTTRTLDVCRLLVSDRNDMVVKAMSWSLRELSRRDPDAVRAFLQEYKGMLAPRVVREVNTKLATGLKNPGRKTTLT